MIAKLTGIYPKRFREHVRQLLVYDGLEYDLSEFLSAATMVIAAASAVGGLLASKVLGLPLIIAFPAVLILLSLSSYSYLILRAERRARFAESVLPDALRLIAANLRAGLTIDRSVMLAARPEFGFFQWELKRVGGRVMSQGSFEDALREMGSRIKSKSLEATIDLLIQGVRGGSNLPNSLEKIADVLSSKEYVKKEIKTGVIMYVWFILFAMLIGAPLLLGISSFLVETLKGLQGSIKFMKTDVIEGLPGTTLPLTVEFIKSFSLASLVMTSTTGSVVIALIKSGNWKNGLKTIPLYCIISITLYFLVGKLLHMMFTIKGVV